MRSALGVRQLELPTKEPLDFFARRDDHAPAHAVVKSPQEKLAAGMREPRDLFRVTRASRSIQAVKATDVENEIEWLGKKIQMRDIADAKIHFHIRALRFIARGGDRLW